MNPLLKYFSKEDNLNRMVAYYLRAEYPNVKWWHTVNEGKRTPLQQLKAKELGILSGVSDIIVISPNKEIKQVLFLELKVKPNRLTENQRNFLQSMKDFGMTISLCFTYEEAVKDIDEFLLDICKYKKQSWR